MAAAAAKRRQNDVGAETVLNAREKLNRSTRSVCEKHMKTFFLPHTIEFPPSHPAASSSPHSDSSSSSAQPPQPPSYFPGYPAPTPTHSLHNHFACELSSFSFLCVLFSLYLPCCCFRSLESFSSLFSIFSTPIPTLVRPTLP